MKANSSYLDKKNGLEFGENTEKNFKIVTLKKNYKAWWRKYYGLGCFSWAGVGNLVKIDGIMTADTYIDTINKNLEKSLLKLGLEGNFIFQQDNDPKHTAKKSQAFFRSCRIKQLEWSPQSPDLNLIENLFWIIELTNAE